MKKKNIVLLIATMVLGLLFSCSDNAEKENDCTLSQTEFVTSVNAPNTGMTNEIINIEVNFAVFNGCGEFGKFIETENGNTRFIEVEATYVGCICTQDIPIRTSHYEFTASNAGDYELNFKSSLTEFITVNLTIN